VDDAPPPEPGDAGHLDDAGVPILDRLLRRPDRVPPWRGLLERLREVDRRLLIALACGAVAVAGVVGIVVAGSGTTSTAEVSLPRAKSDATRTASSASTAGAGSDESDSGTSGSKDPLGVTTTSTGPVVVDVAGAVVRPGLVSVTSGARVADAIAAAGGLRPDADADRLNLASLIGDGARIYVATVGQSSIPVPIGPNTGGAGGTAVPGATTIPAPVDLNSATADQLDTLPGVGPSTAQAILSYRSTHGPFASVDDLDQVRGIGPAKLSQLRDLVTIG